MKCLEHSQVVSIIRIAYLTNILFILLAFGRVQFQETENDSFTFHRLSAAQDGYGIQFCPKRHKGKFAGGFLRSMCLSYKRRDVREALFLLFFLSCLGTLSHEVVKLYLLQ